MRIVILALLASCGLCFISNPALGQDAKEDEEALKALGLATDGPALVKYFRNLILPKANERKVLDLIKRLGDDDFDVRQSASSELRNMGPAIVPILKLNLDSSDPEIAQRAKECLEHVRKSSTEHLVSAAARLMGDRKPAEGVEVLLTYCKYVKDPMVMDAFREGIAAMAMKEGKPDPRLVEAVTSKVENARLLAKACLVHSKAVDVATGKNYLKDESASVRLRVALALVHREEKTAVSELIQLLSEVALEDAWEAEAILFHLAGEKPPENASLGTNQASRINARNVWQKWWEANKEKVQLADLKKRAPYLHLTLIAFQDNFGRGHVMEIDRNNNKRWSLDALNFPIDAEILPNNNVLVAEMYRSRVGEWNVKTQKSVWEYTVSNPVACQLLKNGRVMIASLNELLVLNRKTKAVEMRYRDNGARRGNIYAARAMPNGDFVMATSRSEIVRIDSKGKEQSRFTARGINNYCSIHVLPNNHVLVPQYSTSQVTEYTPEGKAVWTASVRYPTSVYRLPNGRTLVTSMGGRNVVELTRGAQPKTYDTIPVDGSPWHVRRR